MSHGPPSGVNRPNGRGRAILLAVPSPTPRTPPRRAPAVRLANRAPEPFSSRLSRALAAHPLTAFLGHGRRIALLRQLSSLFRAGTALPVALGHLSRFARPSLVAQLSRVREELDRGATFGAALRAHVRALDPTTIELIAFAEESGSLEKVLARLVRQQEELQRLRWKAVVSALWPLYLVAAEVFAGPLFSLSAALAKGAKLGSLTGIYLAGLAENLVVVTATLAAVLAFPLIVRLSGFDAGWERVKLALPGVGRVVRDFARSRLYLALSLGLGAGVELFRALEIAAQSTASPLLLGRLPKVLARLRGGEELAPALTELRLLPPEQLGTVAVAEKAGTLEEAFESLAQDAEEAAMRGLKFVLLAVVALIALVALGTILRQLLGTIFGPIYDYYHLLDHS